MTHLQEVSWCQESLIVPSESIGFQYLNGNEVGKKKKENKEEYRS